MAQKKKCCFILSGDWGKDSLFSIPDDVRRHSDGYKYNSRSSDY